MRKLLRKFVVWVMGANDRDDRAVPVAIGLEQDQERPQASFRLGVIAAANGRILEMSTFKRNNHGPDWTSELFIVPDDQTLAECISTILTVKGLT
jgi:hypothetical protein